MRREPKAFLWDISTAIDAVLTFTEGFDEDAYRASPLVKSAVERQLEIIGEALSQLAKIDVAMFAQIPERRPAIGLRNVLIHGYAMVDDGLVWRTVAKDLPALRERVVTLLEPEKSGSSSDSGRTDE